MGCYPLKTSTVTGMVCTGRQRRSKCATPNCGGRVEALCDYPVTRKGQRTTCSAKLCDRCRVRKGEIDYCPPHGRLEGLGSTDPKIGDHRIHVPTGLDLWVVHVADHEGETQVTFARNPPGERGRCAGPLQTVPLSKWREKTRLAPGTSGTCRGCHARIDWFKSADGKNIPLDHDAHPDGNIVIDDEGVALYAERGRYPAMYLSHFATCPDSERFRKKKT